MSSFAAILVLVACPAHAPHCLSEPVRVVSYAVAAECDRHMDAEIRRAKTGGMTIYGTCNRFDAQLLQGRHPIDMSADVSKVAASDRRAGYGRQETSFLENQ